MRKFFQYILCSVFLVFTTCRSTPNWVQDPYLKYNKQEYFAVLGSGNTRQIAERNAYGNLIALFGQTIRLEEKDSVIFQSIIGNEVKTNWSEYTTTESLIERSANFESLMGAEIGDIWKDGKEYHAVALLEKERTIKIYTGIVQENQKNIGNLIDISPFEKYSFEGLARYQMAATIANMTIPFKNLLMVLGSPIDEFKFDDDFRLETNNIIRALPIDLQVQNDSQERIQTAFSKAINKLGFQNGGVNSRYTLDINITTSPVEYAGNPIKWIRIEVNANLKDNTSGTVLLSYNFSDRQGHNTQTEAENRAFMVAEKNIIEEFTKLLNVYLTGLLIKTDNR